MNVPTVHCDHKRAGILLVNLGTPKAPTASAVRKYLAEFLSDRRVIELSPWLWQPILHGVVLRTRPAASAARYAKVWTPAGSPVLHYAIELAAALHQQLPDEVLVRHAMRYGEPAVSQALDEMMAVGVQRVLVVPMFPQYSSACTASVFDAVFAWARCQRVVPELRLVKDYHDAPAYIDALRQQVEARWQQHGRGEMLLMSFHGVPQKMVDEGDPYQLQCARTASLLATALGLDDSQYRVTFQSQFGKAKWIGPATEATLRALAQQGVSSVDVMCPGFSVDCLETLEEINMECREAFMTSGGKRFQYIACLNAQPASVEALTALTLQHIQGWI